MAQGRSGINSTVESKVLSCPGVMGNMRTLASGLGVSLSRVRPTCGFESPAAAWSRGRQRGVV